MLSRMKPQLTNLVGPVARVVEHKETRGSFFILSVLECLVDCEGEFFPVCLLRFQVVELVGLDIDDALRLTCSRLISLETSGKRRG